MADVGGGGGGDGGGGEIAFLQPWNVSGSTGASEACTAIWLDFHSICPPPPKKNNLLIPIRKRGPLLFKPRALSKVFVCASQCSSI